MSTRRKLILGNWKLNGSRRLMQEVLSELEQVLRAGTPDNVTLAVFPPAIYISELLHLAQKHCDNLLVGGQNISVYARGSFTGELSANMLKEFGCKLCLVGHSERRSLFQENDQSCKIKINLLLDEGITPVLCIGETREEKLAGQTFAVLERQLNQALAGIKLEKGEQLCIAYEPVYAIGSGQAVTPDIAQKTHSDIRKILRNLLDENTSNSISILYGGSVSKENAVSLISCPDVDGLLIGGASIDSQHFSTICKQAFVSASGASPLTNRFSFENYMDAS